MLNRNVTPKRSQSLIAGLAAKRIAEGLLLCGESRSLIEVWITRSGWIAWRVALLCGESRSLIEVRCLRRRWSSTDRLLCGESRSLIEVVQAEDGHLCATRLLCGESRSLIEV